MYQFLQICEITQRTPIHKNDRGVVGIKTHVIYDYQLQSAAFVCGFLLLLFSIG